MPETVLLTAAETHAITGVPLKTVHKLIDERLAPPLVRRGRRERRLTLPGAVCVKLDTTLPSYLPVALRRSLYRAIGRTPQRLVFEIGAGPVRHVVDIRPVESDVGKALSRYRRAMRLIVEDPEIQGGAATFKGTRLLVHHIAALLRHGTSREELREDYPRLTEAMIEAARIFAIAHPKRGRPKPPPWRGRKPLAMQVVPAAPST
ncbi:MAG TPA: DUF433 domain-containing protein [Vineibacter sp.]|nr:DUF433 domain-containing protein [Vineibacter sp.]